MVICDCATRYPEAAPLRSVDIEHIAKELVELFMRVGVLAEILTDQDRNCMSQLLMEVYCLLQPGRTKGLVKPKCQIVRVQPGTLVLVLLPISASKLLARWQGPCNIV